MTSSLADLIEVTRRDTSMWKGRRDAIARSLAAVACLLGSEAEELPAAPKKLLRHAERQLLQSAKGRADWDRLLPGLRAAVERWGLSEAPGRYAARLTDDWQTTSDSLADERTRQTLARFMNFLSARGVPPDRVDDGHVATYAAVTAAEGMVRRPGTDLREVRVAWNRLSGPGKFREAVSVPLRDDVYALEAERFPFSFRMELESYLAFRARDVLSSGRTPLRTASLRSIRHAVFSYASALVHSGKPPATIVSLAHVATPEMVRVALTYMAAREGRRRTRQMTHVTSAVAAIGRLWVDVTTDVQVALDELRRAFGWHHHGVALANRILVSQFDDGVRTASLLSLPQRLAALARREPAGRRRARIFMTALVVELLLSAPLRPSELLSIDVERDIVFGAREPEAVLVTQYRNLSIRTRRVPLGAACRSLMAAYLKNHRPMLLDGATAALLPGDCGGSIGPGALRRLIRLWSMRLADVEMTPTLFRHFAAKHYLEAHPGDFEVVRVLLGHTLIVSTVKTYSRLDVSGAARCADAQLLGIGPPGRPLEVTRSARLEVANPGFQRNRRRGRAAA